MADHPKPVLVLGAGFTRAFLPAAPLLKDRYDTKSLLDTFNGFPHARRILELELARNSNGEIDIERLMTRLDGRMPYDFHQGADQELGLLLTHVKRAFARRLEDAKAGTFHAEELAAFAKYCVDNGVTCITFNYDDVLDQALWEVKKIGHITNEPYWHPDGGYGFFCKPSESCVRAALVTMDQCPGLLLKLHGSINWRPKLGYSQPYSIDAIVHHELWSPSKELAMPGPLDGVRSEDAIELHLEPEPFIVPPILMKSALVEQPILRTIWSLAHQALSRAEQVIFVGYSMPSTDVAAGFLFGEALEKRDFRQLRVVNNATDDEKKQEVMASYRKVFPKTVADQFEFRDALKWASEVASRTAETQ